MKTAKVLLPLFLVLFVLFGASCSFQEKKEVQTVIKRDLDLLKNLDSDAAQKYISQDSLFPGSSQDTGKSQTEINELFSLFFQDFDYKLLDTHIANDKTTASASLRLTTLDAQALARDYAAACLQKEILHLAANADQSTGELSLKERYLLLNELLKNTSYDTVTNSCTIQLEKEPGKKDAPWEISRTYSLENDLVGGLMDDLSDPDILPAIDTLTVYFDTLKTMDKDQMSRFLGVESLLNSEDPDKNAIAAALAQQVHQHFNYEITDCKENGYQAQVTVKITTLDSDAILSSYQEQLDAYLASPSAVIDGASKRLSNSYAMLLDCIQSNEAVRTVTTVFSLTNDGGSWHLNTEDGTLGSAIFGTLATSPLSQEDQEE